MTDADPVAVLAHELRSPVAALAAIAAAYPDADAGRRERLLELAAAAVTGIERLLAEAPPRVDRVDVGRVVLDAVETATLPATGIAIGAEVENGLVVDGDPGRLRQILDNLIGNAIGHSPEGGAVTVTARRSGAAILVEVRDEGEGIPAADLERAFAAGVRLTADRPGSGLGLAVVRGIARAHGGDVEAESPPGSGATFRLVLPAASGES